LWDEWDRTSGLPKPPAWGWQSCGGRISIVATPKMNRFQVPHAQIVSGDQRYPALNPESLQTAVMSSLSSISRVKVEQSASIRPERIGADNKSKYFIKSFVTQVDRSLGEAESSLSSINPLALLGTFSSKERVGMVRMDVQVVSLYDGRYVAAFPVVGEMRDSDSSFSFLAGFDVYGTSSKTQALVTEALKVSMKKLHGELSELISQWRVEQ
jgi:hypothetical protein